MDVRVQRAITEGLRLQDVYVLTAPDDGAAQLPEYSLLQRASDLGSPLFTCDDDLLDIAADWFQQHVVKEAHSRPFLSFPIDLVDAGGGFRLR